MYQNSDFGSPPSSCAIAAGGCTCSERFSWASSSFARIGKRGASGTLPKICSRCLRQSAWSVRPRKGPSCTTLCASGRSTISHDSPMRTRGRQTFAIKRLQTAAAPDPFHKDRLEHQRLGEIGAVASMDSQRRKMRFVNLAARQSGRARLRRAARRIELSIPSARQSLALPSGSEIVVTANYLGNTMLVRSLVKYWAPVIAWMLLIFVPQVT